jgi:hypothetical protein
MGADHGDMTRGIREAPFIVNQPRRLPSRPAINAWVLLVEILR